MKPLELDLLIALGSKCLGMGCLHSSGNGKARLHVTPHDAKLLRPKLAFVVAAPGHDCESKEKFIDCEARVCSVHQPKFLFSNQTNEGVSHNVRTKTRFWPCWMNQKDWQCN